MVDDDGRAAGRGGAARRVWRNLRITVAAEKAARSGRIRARTLLVIVALGFTILGTVRSFAAMDALAASPINLDIALRTVSAGWFAPRNVLPVAVVEIDEATHRAWGSPAVTPRDHLASLIDAVAQAGPAALVVDIDLAWGGEDPGLPLLAEYLAAYAGPAPLVFPKRIDPAAGGNRQAASSPLDPLFERNEHLAWAHASFETDSSGIVRQWADWIEVCSEERTYQLPSIPARLSLMMAPPAHGLQPATPPPLTGSCRRADDPAGQLLLIGPRFTGPASRGMSADAAAVSALMLLDPELDRDDTWLFADRVVLIGATYAASGDFWLTPSGMLPGVEMVGHTVRFAGLRTASGWRASLAHRVAVLTGFVLLVLVSIHLLGLAAAVAYIAGTLLFVAIPIWLWSYYRIFDALEVAVLLFILFKFLQAIFDMREDWIARRALHPPGWRGGLRTVWSVCHQSDQGERGA